MPSSTAKNLRLIQQGRRLRSADDGWLQGIIESLDPTPTTAAPATVSETATAES